MNVFNNVILARNKQLPDDDRMIETCRSIFKKSFNIKLSECISWYADWVNKLMVSVKNKNVLLFNLLATNFDVLLTVRLSIILVINQLNAQNLVL